MWEKAEGRGYTRLIQGEALVRSMMTAFVARFSGLREIAERMGDRLGTRNFSSLSHALARPSTLALARAMVEHLTSRRTPCKEEMIALDSMAVSLPITQNHQCVKINRNTVGGGVLWAFRIQAKRGTCPVSILRTMAGAWMDAGLMKGVALIARGPIYLMDRGFYSLGLIENWRTQGVRFVMRAKHNSIYEVIRNMGSGRKYGPKGRIEVDALVRLGGDGVPAHPIVRYVRAQVGKESITLVSSEITWTAEQILAAYKKRQRIERFHRLVKDTIGLAHLYNFSQNGIMALLHIALLVALLLFMGQTQPLGDQDTLTVMRKAFNLARKMLGLGIPWRRNTNAVKRSPHARLAKWQLNP